MGQLGFGWGRGRRVIKTVYAGDRLQAALARQRQWVHAHGVEETLGGLNQPVVENTQPIGDSFQFGRIKPTAALRMAKARVRSELR